MKARPSEAETVDRRTESNGFRQALLRGLTGAGKHIPAKYFYDARGSALFDRISTLPEYYLTRTEEALLAHYGREIAQFMGDGATLVEFGAGSLNKVESLLSPRGNIRAYAPIDISKQHLREMAAQLRKRRPDLEIYPVEADYTESIALPGAVSGARKAGLFLGSTIGNLERNEAVGFLRKAAALLDGGGLLVGIDLLKHPALLHAAYNDADGVTEAFNKNLLVRANRELGANFALSAFAHYAFYNPPQHKIEMHLISLERQHVCVAGSSIEFRAGDAIHTEDSRKYTPQEFDSLAAEAGLMSVRSWQDERGWFSLHWLVRRKS